MAKSPSPALLFLQSTELFPASVSLLGNWESHFSPGHRGSGELIHVKAPEYHLTRSQKHQPQVVMNGDAGSLRLAVVGASAHEGQAQGGCILHPALSSSRFAPAAS